VQIPQQSLINNIYLWVDNDLKKKYIVYIVSVNRFNRFNRLQMYYRQHYQLTFQFNFQTQPLKIINVLGLGN